MTRTKFHVVSDLPFPIKESMRFGGITVVRLEVPTGSVLNENVFGVNQTGSIVWQIPPLPNAYQKTEDRSSPYVGLIRMGEKIVRAGNWSGTDVDLSVTDGRVLGTEWGK